MGFGLCPGGTEGGRDGRREDKCGSTVPTLGRRHGARERGSEGGKGKGRERESVWQYCVLVCSQKALQKTQLHRKCAG